MTPLDHTYNQSAARFAALVKEKSKGRIEIAIYPDGQLAKGERELLEAVQQGRIVFYVAPQGPSAGSAPPWVFSICPFSFGITVMSIKSWTAP
ncbi:MAG TPA: hypothetical protein PK175_11090 [Syntrophales bacterium]|nr:hypothetical protein [Syntrophales bacterium]HPC33564.1 hypothetical protein [Syntrophales bacterium]HQG35410.1 hypothetical protein [Syntrophales bacterium]HQI35812.1 hypothetical protein [Syntrophales bacterium]HRR48117.1 hypothetical protein [Syntrophales bacterium]